MQFYKAADSRVKGDWVCMLFFFGLNYMHTKCM